MDAYSNTVRKTIRTDTHFVRQKAFLEHPFRGDDGGVGSLTMRDGNDTASVMPGKAGIHGR
jgi:hypothetical protein